MNEPEVAEVQESGRKGRPEQVSRETSPSKHAKSRNAYGGSPLWRTVPKQTIHSFVVASKLQKVPTKDIARDARISPREVEKIWNTFKRKYMTAAKKHAAGTKEESAA